MKRSPKSPAKFELIELPNRQSWRLELPDGDILLTSMNGKLTYERALFLLARGQYIMHRDAAELIEED